MNVNSVNHSNLLKNKSHNIFKHSMWNNLNILFVIIVFFLSIIFIFSFFPKHAHYQIVCNQLSSEDSILIISKLIKMKIPYRYIVHSNELLVPEDNILKVHLMLLSEGLPKQKNLGFELMDQEKFGISPFNAHINYQRALEGELSRSIQRIHAIKTVQVHIAFPQKFSFAKNNILPSASVIIGLKHGKYLNFTQCRAITDLISASVPELLPKNIVMLDENGNYLNKKNISIKNIHFTKWNTIHFLEKQYYNKIIYVLQPILKLKNCRIQVHITRNHDTNDCKKHFQFDKNKNFMIDNIHYFLSLTFAKQTKNIISNSSKHKYSTFVLVLINYLKNKKNQLVPLNNMQIFKIKNLISEVIHSNNVDCSNIKIINMKFSTYVKKNMYYNYLTYYLKHTINYVLCIIIFSILYFIIKLLHIFKMQSLNNTEKRSYKKIRSKSIHADNINDNCIISEEDLQKNIHNHEFIKNIAKNNPKVIAMIIQSWINKQK